MRIKAWKNHSNTGAVGGNSEAAAEVATAPGARDVMAIPVAMQFPRKCPRYRSRFCTISSIDSHNHHHRRRITRSRRTAQISSNCWRQRQRSKNTIHQRRIPGITFNCRHNIRPRQRRRWSTRKSTSATSQSSIRSNTRSNSFSTRTRNPIATA